MASDFGRYFEDNELVGPGRELALAPELAKLGDDAQERLIDIGAQIVARSVGDEPATVKLIAKHDLEFPVGHSADTAALAAATGAFINGERVYLQSTRFVLDPGGRVVVSVYSSGAIGRLVPEDVIGLIRHLREHAA